MGFLRFFEPEETVGNLWHDLANRIGDEYFHEHAAVSLSPLRGSLAVLFRALGGGHDVEVVEAPVARVRHKRSFRRRLSHGNESIARASFDGERLRLPPVIGDFDSTELNHATFLWLTASAALADVSNIELPSADAAPGILDQHSVTNNIQVSDRVLSACPGLSRAFESLRAETLLRRKHLLERVSGTERCVRKFLAEGSAESPGRVAAEQALRIYPVPFWLDFVAPLSGGDATDQSSPEPAPPPSAAEGALKRGNRRDLDQANRKDSFIIHRFESILSWVESMDINRTVQDDDDENAKKAAEDQDSVTLSRHDRKTASRLHLHLDLSPSEAEHERIAGKYTYPEWNHRRQAYMADHCRVLEAEAELPEHISFDPDLRSAERVRRQFEMLRTRRILQTRQTDGSEFDLDALIAARADLLATGRGSDRIYIDSRKSQRDLSVGLLLDASRSTEADMDGTCVIDVARNALTSLAHGLDACGDRFGIWSFSSLKRNRVFVTRCKDFDTPMSTRIDRRIAGLQPGHYTRLGAAIRHASMRLEKEPSAQKLLLVLTDGKPNDVDHYEGKHGIEDSRMAVREARRKGLVVHAVIIDEDGQDWFARIFEHGGFTLLPRPERLMKALPEIYRSLTQEF